MNNLCLNPLFLRILYISGKTLSVLRFVIPIILIIKVVKDVYKRVINPNDDEGKKYIKNRVIACIIIFLIPTIVKAFFSIIEGIIGNNYSDLAVCREFANLEYIEALEKDLDKIKMDAYDNEKNNNLSTFQQIAESVRQYVANNKNNSINNDDNSDSNNNTTNTNQDDSNLSGSLNAKKYSDWNYYLYVPDDAKTSKKPLVIFLHGSGERGSNISSLERYGFAKYIKKKRSNYDAYILIPQLASGEKWDTDTNRNKLMSLIQKTVRENNIDQSRISISGFSLGTVVIPNLIKENQNYFSVVVFIGLCTDADSKASYFRNTPTRLYHGGSDGNCKPSHSKSFAETLKKNSGRVELFILNNRPHNIVDDVFEDKSVFNWMISQKR